MCRTQKSFADQKQLFWLCTSSCAFLMCGFEVVHGKFSPCPQWVVILQMGVVLLHACRIRNITLSIECGGWCAGMGNTGSYIVRRYRTGLFPDSTEWGGSLSLSLAAGRSVGGVSSNWSCNIIIYTVLTMDVCQRIFKCLSGGRRKWWLYFVLFCSVRGFTPISTLVITN